MHTRSSSTRRSSVPAVDVSEGGGDILKVADVIERSPLPAFIHPIDVLSPISEEQRDAVGNHVSRPNKWTYNGHTRTSSLLSDSSMSNASSNGSTSFTVMPHTLYTTTPLTFTDYQQQSQFVASTQETAPVTTSSPRTQVNKSNRSAEVEQKLCDQPAPRLSIPRHFVFPKDRYPSNPVSRNTESSRSSLESVSLASQPNTVLKVSRDQLHPTTGTVLPQSCPSEAVIATKPANLEPPIHESVLPPIVQSMLGGSIYG